MIEITEQIDVDAPPTAVFDFVADPRNHVQFTPSLMAVSDVREGDVGKEGEFTFKMAGTSLDGRFIDTAFDRPAERRYEFEGDLGGSVTWRIAPADGGSQVRYETRLDLPGPDVLGALTDPVARRYLQREADSTLENLRDLVEAREHDSGEQPA